MEQEGFRSLIGDDMRAVDQIIRERLASDVTLIDQIGNYIINGGGKRLRPMVLVLAARAFGYDGTHHRDLAAVIEFIHTATLLHDDVVDVSELRRGNETANSIWGNAASVLVGDFLYSRSFEMMVDVNSMRIMEILSHATNAIAAGEVMQLMHCHDPDTTEECYLEVIRRKTAKLFEAGAQLGAVLGSASDEQEQALATYGTHLGTAFQLIDDVLDYSASSEVIGKNIGDDLAEGKPTLPLIHTLRKGTPAQVRTIRQAIQIDGRRNIDAVLKAIESTGAISYTRQVAMQEASKAIEALACIGQSPYKDALLGLAERSASRSY